MDDEARQRILDVEHLRLLRIGYFVMGGTAAFTGLFGLLYAAMGLLFGSLAASFPQGSREAPPAFMGWLFMGVGLFIVLAAGGYAALTFLTARGLGHRHSRTLCLVTAGLSCLYIPFGTVLGIFTFSVLARPSVHLLFERGSPPSFPSPPIPPPPPPSPGPAGV